MGRLTIVLGALVATCAAGCASVGDGPEKTSPTISAPTVNQAPDRAAPTLTPALAETETPRTASPARVSTESRHMLPDPKASSMPLDQRYEYRLYNYLPVNEKGQNELGLLMRQLIPDGWELHQVQVAPVNHCKAIFRRDRLMPIRLTPAAKPALVLPLPAAGTAPPSVAPPSGTPAGTTGSTGTPSSLPPAPAR
jgi:hypothetical protein